MANVKYGKLVLNKGNAQKSPKKVYPNNRAPSGFNPETDMASILSDDSVLSVVESLEAVEHAGGMVHVTHPTRLKGLKTESLDGSYATKYSYPMLDGDIIRWKDMMYCLNDAVRQINDKFGYDMVILNKNMVVNDSISYWMNPDLPHAIVGCKEIWDRRGSEWIPMSLMVPCMVGINREPAYIELLKKEMGIS